MANACRASPRRSALSRGRGWCCGRSSPELPGLPGLLGLLGGSFRVAGRRFPVSVAGQRIFDRVVDVKDLAQPGNPENPQNTALRADKINPAVEGAYPFKAPDKPAQPGRVEKLGPFHVNDQTVVARV